MDHFALLPAAERATVFRAAAARSRLGSATILEKDFWVCWALQRIFSISTLPGPLFKGGTSLSKAYNAIERFSEDVDIVLDRHALGFIGEQDPTNIAGTNKRNGKLDELAGKCSETVQGTVRDELQNSLCGHR
jgi:Nucleotidyl transferase AbiEii toxin, Type IV TA system